MSLIPNCKIPVQTICFLQLVIYHSYFTHREPFSKGFLYQSSRSYQNSVKNTLFRPYPMYSLLLTSSYSFKEWLLANDVQSSWNTFLGQSRCRLNLNFSPPWRSADQTLPQHALPAGKGLCDLNLVSRSNVKVISHLFVISLCGYYFL